MRSGSTGVEMAEQMLSLSRELLPLASPVMDRVHQRYLQHFIEQDVVGHMEVESDGQGPALGRMRVAIAFADLAGYTRLTEEVGELEAVDAVERFVEAVEVTLPDDARVIKTIGDEVMIVGSDPLGADRLGGGLPAPARGPAAAADRDPLRRGAVPGRRLLRPRRQHRLARGGSRRGRRGAGHAAGGRAGRIAPELRADRRDHAEGLHRVDRDLPRPRRRKRGSARSGPRRGAAGLRTAGGGAVLGRARLHLPARPGGADRRAGGGQRAARQLRAAGGGRRRTSATAPRLCAAAGGGARGPPPAAVRSGATSRPGRASSATARRRRSRPGATPTSRRAIPPPIRSRRSSTGWPPRPAAARCWGCARATAGWSGRCFSYTREQTGGLLPGARACRWREDESNDSEAYVRARIRSRLVPALRDIHPAAERNVLALAEILRDEAEVLDGLVDDGSTGATEIALGAPARAAAGPARAGRPAAGRRRRRRPGRRGGPPGRRGGGAARARPRRARPSPRRPGDSRRGVLRFERAPLVPTP